MKAHLERFVGATRTDQKISCAQPGRELPRYASYARGALGICIALLCGVVTAADPEYRFPIGPYPEGGGDGATNPAMCTDGTQSWYPSPNDACQAAKGVHPNCDRRSADYQGHVTTLTSPTTCSMSWQYRNKGSSGWYSWSAAMSVQTRCPRGMVLDPTRPNICIEFQVLEKTRAAKNSTCASNPVFPLTGAKKEFVSTGFSLSGVNLQLTYDTTSNLPANQVATNTISEPSPLGALWKSSLHRTLQVSSGLKTAVASRGDGTVASFSGDGAGNFSSAGGHGHKLVVITGGYRLTDGETAALETYDTAGRLRTLEAADGRKLTFTYVAANLSKVQDDTGRTITFQWNVNDLVTKIVGPGELAILLSYDSHRNLTAITWPDGKSRGFLYESVGLPWALTGKIDEDNSRYATFAYDGNGRAILSEHAGGADRHEFSYGVPAQRLITDSFDPVTEVLSRNAVWSKPEGISMRKPDGQVSAMSADVVSGSPALTGQSQPAGSGCAAATAAVEYDARGNVLSRVKFDGTRVCYAYDTSDREIVRIEGLPGAAVCSQVLPAVSSLPGGARRITTAWHPDWNLPVSITEPLRRSKNVYQGQPDPSNGNVPASCSPAALRSDGKPLPLLCKRIVEPLSGAGSVDAEIPARIETFAYDHGGRVLSSTDPNLKTATFTYYVDTSFSGGPYDTSFDKVVLLLHGNGPEGSTVIADDSPMPFAVTATGNAKLSGAKAVFGGSAMAFDGLGDYVLLPPSNAFDFGAGDFTVEAFVYKNANNPDWSRIWNPNADVVDGVALAIDPSGNFGAYISTGGSVWDYSLPAVANLANGRWYHLAVVRSGGTVYAFVDGIRQTVTSALGSTALYHYPGARVIGGQAGVNRALNGHVDEFRITKGVARYTADFAPPAQEFAPAGPGPNALGHSVGDLASHTSPAGHVTHFDAYDPAGRVRQVTDAKGVVSSFTYTPRGFVSSQSMAATGTSPRTTIFAYGDTGLLAGVSQPDGTTLAYSYDAAHRLTGITDGRGNSITYTLDASGNRIGEDVKDPGGVLRRSVARSFDALNRVQQVTGAAE